jgi:hypothetical protein
MNARLAAAAVVLIALAGTHWKAYDFGKTKIEAAWQAEKLESEQQAENNRLLAQSRINKIDRTGAARAKKRADIDQSTLAKVDEYAPSTLPLLPGSVRVLHDAAATGEEIDDSRTADAAPVAASHLAATSARNYIVARKDQGALEELQAIVKASGCFDVEE